MIATPIYDQCLREWKADHAGLEPGEVGRPLQEAVLNLRNAGVKAQASVDKMAAAMKASRSAPRKTTTKRSRR